jgi:hypothetical protein
MSAVGGAAGQFAGIASSVGADTGAGAGVGKSVSAWRRVFEREQLAALAQFRSVAMGGGREAGAYGMSSGQPKCAAPTARDTPLAVSSAHTSQPGGESALATQARPALHDHFVHAANPSRLEVPIGTGAWGSQAAVRAPSQEALQALQAPLASMSVHQTALLSSADWPWRKLHCTVDADGVHVWLRDATIGAEDNALLDWIGQLRQALAQSGARLASFTLNGTAISPIA